MAHSGNAVPNAGRNEPAMSPLETIRVFYDALERWLRPSLTDGASAAAA